MKNNVNNTTNNTTKATNAETLKKASVLKSTNAYNAVKTTFSYNEKVDLIVAVMSDKQKVKSLIGSLKQSTAFNAFLCLQDVKTQKDYSSLWDNLKESLKEKGYRLAGTPLHKCFCSIWYLKNEQKALFAKLTGGKNATDAFLSLSRFLKEKELSFTAPVSKIKDALNCKAPETAETAETAENPIEKAIRLIRENIESVTSEQANAIIALLEEQYLKDEKVA